MALTTNVVSFPTETLRPAVICTIVILRFSCRVIRIHVPKHTNNEIRYLFCSKRRTTPAARILRDELDELKPQLPAVAVFLERQGGVTLSRITCHKRRRALLRLYSAFLRLFPIISRVSSRNNVVLLQPSKANKVCSRISTRFPRLVARRTNRFNIIFVPKFTF